MPPTIRRVLITGATGTLGRKVVGAATAAGHHVRAMSRRGGIDVVSLDPFVKTHGVVENSNDHMDAVVEVLADLATEHQIAADIPHHTTKGNSEAGNADRGRGASAVKDGGRLVDTLTPMGPGRSPALPHPGA